MKPCHLLPVLLCMTLLAGCATGNRRSTQAGPPGRVAVRLTSLGGLEGSMSDARIYVDGRFVGNYAPDETVLELPVGKRKVRVEVPHAQEMQERPDGTRTVRFFALKGEETIDVLGGESRQTLVFSSENLLAREIHDEDGH